MKLPRDITGNDLAKALVKLGYHVNRQTGSHIRLSTVENGEHNITIPAHNPLKIGTLAAILSDIHPSHAYAGRSVEAPLLNFPYSNRKEHPARPPQCYV